MAAWTLAAGLAGASPADDRTTPPTPPAPAKAKAPGPNAAEAKAAPGACLVQVDLSIAGLTSKGCDVEVKPAYPGCTFRPVTRHVDKDGHALVELKDVRTESADRDCTLAITVREPGQPARTVHRGLRLNPAGGRAQQITCLVNSPSRVARGAAQPTTRR
jgi:hypothetical protein